MSVSKSGNTLTISSIDPFKGSARITATRNNIPVVSESAKLIAYGDPNLQDLVTGVENADGVSAYLNVETPTGTIALKKTSEDGKVEGITFTVAGNGINQTVTTNAAGELLIDGLTPGVYTVEYNTTANDVNEQVIKGNIALIKHTDDGETKLETPEVGAEFSVYLKSSGSYDAARDSERDYLVCDENGFAQTKELHYGIYTVHQVSGWEGRELLADFDVYIAKDGQVYRYLANNANFESYIKVIKVDAETGKTIPYAGAGFQLYRPDGSKVEMTFTYPTPTTIDTFYTNDEGYLVTPEKLEYGSGDSLVEVSASGTSAG